jgi:GxxExxY protein
MNINQFAAIVVDVAFAIHRQLGSGLLESVYLEILYHELRKRGLHVIKEAPIPLWWDGARLNTVYRADLLVEDVLIVELKSVEHVIPAHKKQVLTYLRLADKRLGLLINFGERLLKDGITRIANGMPD